MIFPPSCIPQPASSSFLHETGGRDTSSVSIIIPLIIHRKGNNRYTYYFYIIFTFSCLLRGSRSGPSYGFFPSQPSRGLSPNHSRPVRVSPFPRVSKSPAPSSGISFSDLDFPDFSAFMRFDFSNRLIYAPSGAFIHNINQHDTGRPKKPATVSRGKTMQTAALVT